MVTAILVAQESKTFSDVDSSRGVLVWWLSDMDSEESGIRHHEPKMQVRYIEKFKDPAAEIREAGLKDSEILGYSLVWSTAKFEPSKDNPKKAIGRINSAYSGGQGWEGYFELSENSQTELDSLVLIGCGSNLSLK